MSDPMTPERLEAIRDRCEKAQKGFHVVRTSMLNELLLVSEQRSIQMPKNDAIFFANAWTDIPLLLAEVARLKAFAKSEYFLGANEGAVRQSDHDKIDFKKYQAKIDRLTVENQALKDAIAALKVVNLKDDGGLS